MSIEYELSTREEMINENLKLMFTSKMEEYYSWEEVILCNRGHQIKIGEYCTDGIAGFKEWIEYNDKSIVIFGKNKYTQTPYIKIVYDILADYFVQGTQIELANYYREAFQEKAKTKALIYSRKIGNNNIS